MFPFFRGDLVIVSNTTDSIDIGEIIAFRIPGRNAIILHRVVERRESSFAPGETLFLTRGDWNPVDDRGLYRKGQMWLQRHEIIGIVSSLCASSSSSFNCNQ
jgi:signal peptidase I